MTLPNCWNIKNCGREKGGAKVTELGECVASQEGLGHSCWAIAGTMCGGVVQGTVAQKEKNCMLCEVYKKYHRVIGTERVLVAAQYDDEDQRYTSLLRSRMQSHAQA